MYYEIQNKHYYSLCINNEIYFLNELELYIRNKLLLRKIKHTTLKTILSTLKIFIFWAISNPVNKNEELDFYLARFLKDEENGFEIYNTTFVKDINEDIEYLELIVNPKIPATIEKDKLIIEDYLKSTNQELFKTFNLEKNLKSYSHKIKYSQSNGYGLKMGKISQNVFVNEKSLLPSYRNTIEDDIKVFPYKLFNSLLELANPRERLIYLLCGACSARVSQVLNFTLYDIDYTNKQVWLIDPRSNDQLGFHGRGRKQFLKEFYNIDANKDKPHSNIGFKAPIPLYFKSRTPLFWVSNKYKELFFETLCNYKFIPESSRIPMHPFAFITNSGKRLSPQQVDKSFKNHCNKLKKIHPKYLNQLDRLGAHSLRHMFGSIMASVQAYFIMNKNNLNINIPPEQIKLITKEAMGHKNIKSTDIYFNRPWNLDIELAEYLSDIYKDIMKSLTHDEIQEKYGDKRLKK